MYDKSVKLLLEKHVQHIIFFSALELTQIVSVNFKTN